LLLLVFIGVAAQFALWPPAWADAVYLGVTLPLWSRVTSLLVTSVPGSLSAALLLVVAVIVVVSVLAGRRPGRRALRFVLWLLALGIATFPFTFGLGYHTTTLEQRLGLTAPAVGGGLDVGGAGPQAAALGQSLVSIASEAALTVLSESATALGAVVASGDARPPSTEAAARCVDEYVATFTDAPRATVAGTVKSLPSGWMLRFGFAGIVNPWLLEPHVDSGLPTSAALAVALHELAHTVGFAREAEAEAVALIAGMTCADAGVRYAASLRAATTFAGLLMPDARESYLSRWPDVARTDAAAATAAQERYHSRAAADIAATVYDTYLSSQGAADGMDDYGRAATIVAQVIGRDGVPAIRTP